MSNVRQHNHNMTATVFVSSTFLDLQTHRKAIWETLASFDVNVRGMEQFGARTETPLQTCLLEVDQSDIYVGIIAFRLGSVEPTTGKSYTQLEYERAHSLSKAIFIYLIDEENARVPVKFIDRGDALEKLESFKGILRERHTIDTFVDEADLARKLKRDLERHAKPRPGGTVAADGWVESAERLRRYMLVPKSLAGTEVLLCLKVLGEPYPASSAICEAFNFEVGATAGMRVEVVRPTGANFPEFPDLYVPAKLLSQLTGVAKGDEIEGFMRLHFSPKELPSFRARLRTRTEYPDSPFVASALKNVLGSSVHYPADLGLAVELSKLLQFRRTGAA